MRAQKKQSRNRHEGEIRGERERETNALLFTSTQNASECAMGVNGNGRKEWNGSAHAAVYFSCWKINTYICCDFRMCIVPTAILMHTQLQTVSDEHMQWAMYAWRTMHVREWSVSFMSFKITVHATRFRLRFRTHERAIHVPTEMTMTTTATTTQIKQFIKSSRKKKENIKNSQEEESRWNVGECQQTIHITYFKLHVFEM